MSQTAIAHLNIDALKELPDDAPVTMLNLMRFRDRSRAGKGSGWDAYLRYSALSIKLIKGVGGTIVWTGEAQSVALGVPEAHRWAYLPLFPYPSPAPFLALIPSPHYQPPTL